jgi:hypothetical protein
VVPGGADRSEQLHVAALHSTVHGSLQCRHVLDFSAVEVDAFLGQQRSEFLE